MNKQKFFLAQMFNKLLETLSRFFLKTHSKEEFPTRICINEVNAIISCLPEKERELLPASLVEYFAERADLPPSKVFDMSKPLEQQSFSDETLLFMFYINTIFKEIEKSSAATEEEMQNAQVHATKQFIMMLDNNADNLLCN